MKRYETANIRNVALAGHGGTGKTSLGEAILFTTQATTRLGTVEGSTSTFDYEPEEVDRKTSYASGVASTEWKKHKINVVDTPGDSVFMADTRLCMQATDLTLLIISAVDAVEVGSERVWESAAELKRPRIIFVNKMDKERANFDTAVAELQDVWGPNIAPLQIPIGSEADFKGVVDLLDMKAHIYSMDGKGDGAIGDVPADLQDAAAEAREALIEAIASADDELIEKYLEEGELSESEVRAGLKAAIQSGELVPVLCGSATKNAATDVLLDVLCAVAPSPADVALPQCVDAAGEPIEFTGSESDPFAALVFKTTYLEMGKVCMVRVFQGKGDPDLSFFNVSRDTKERWGQVLMPFGRKLESLGSGVAVGDIIAVPKLKEAIAGNVLCAEKHHIEILTPVVPEPCISYALKSRKKGDEDKIASALGRVLHGDVSLRTNRDPQTKDHLLSGMGQTHIEVAVAKMKRFGGDVELLPPRVPYRECIRNKVTHVEGKHKKQSGGRGQFGVVYIDMEPAERGAGFVFDNGIFGGSIPSGFIPSIQKGMDSVMKTGVLAGYPVVDVKVRLTDGKFHPVDSDGRSFEIAGRKGFKEAFMKCSPTLMEPIMDMEITVPDDSLGDVMGDLSSRRGRPSGMDARRGRQVIKAQVPMSEVLAYSPDLRSLTGGRGTFTSSFSHYEEVPGNLVEKVVAEVGSLDDDD